MPGAARRRTRAACPAVPRGHDARRRSTSPEQDDRRRSREHESRGGLADGPSAALRAYHGNLRVGRARPR